jgi:hypothetical protein
LRYSSTLEVCLDGTVDGDIAQIAHLIINRGACREFCVLGINMTNRTIYAEQDEVAECGHCGPEGGVAEDIERTD